MQNSLIHPKLAHLTGDEIKLLVHEYFADVKVDTLINRFNIHCTRGQFFKLLPPKQSGQFCPECATEMLSPMPSKNASSFLSEEQLYCPQCLNKPRSSHKKRAPYDIQPKQPLHATPLKLVSNGHLSADNLTIEQAIALRAVVAYSAPNRQMTNGRHAPRNKLVPLAPTYEYSRQLTLSLENLGVLSPVEQRDNRAVSASKVNNKLCVFGAQYIITEALTQELVEEVQHRLLKLNWPDRWYDEISLVIFDLAFAEIKEFYEFCIHERNLPHVNDKRITNIILNLLEDFSVGQCFHIIFRGAQSATDFMVRSNASPSYAADYMLTTSQKYADRARDSNKDLFHFSRNWNCPRSLMSTILYNDVLKMNGEGITTPILEVVP